MKTAKIISVQENQRNYQSQNGQVFIHLVEYEGDQTIWEYHSKSAVCEKFKVGQMADFETDVKQNGQYTNYKIKPAQQNNFSKAPMKDEGTITYLSVFSSCCNYFAQRSNTSEDVFAMAEKAFNIAVSKSTLK